MSGRALLLAVACLAALGCDSGLDTAYGVSRGRSLNGTSVMAELFRNRGDTVRVAWQLDDELGVWADTIVRFCPYPGPPDFREGYWYLDWLEASPRHRLIYVLRDYEAVVEYWTAVRDRLPANAAEERRRASKALKQARTEEELFGSLTGSPSPLDSEGWFTIEDGPPRPHPIKHLKGPWALGIDASRAALSQRDRLLPDDPDLSRVLLAGEDSALAIETEAFGGKGLIVANGSFLLNGALLNPERRPLASRVVDWVGEGPRKVVFIEGGAPWDTSGDGESDSRPSGFSLLGSWPELRWVVVHLLLFGLLAALAASVRLGRPRPALPSGVDRPAAHAEALGDLLARTRDRNAAWAILETYRRWRQPREAP